MKVMYEDNVIKFDPDAKKPWIAIEIGNKRCKHAHVVVNASDRVVFCDDCEAMLDPINILNDIAHSRREGYYCSSELKRMRGIIAGLKEDEKRTKARLKNARKKLAEECHVGEDCPNVKTWKNRYFELIRSKKVRVD